ncbi:MAG: hypothetical protein ABH830_02185, partial [Patescibacteria group bacterium]
FHKTVNLRQPVKKPMASRVEEIDQVYNNEGEMNKADFNRINKPKLRRVNEPIFKRIIILLAIIMAGAIIYWLFFHGGGEKVKENTTLWYSIKLVNGEIYYGQIIDIKADPVVVNNVYYNYDQLNAEPNAATDKAGTSNIRLVKRGKETHGPDGTMDIVRAQILYMEPLREDSKVLRAILDYEH